jgi:tetratricopeptide (TPR) repeat protein
LFSVLYAFWVANFVAFNGEVCRDLAAQFLALAEKQRATIPIMIGHRLMGLSLLFTGDIAAARAHLDQSIALYDPAEHRQVATRFGVDSRVAVLSYRSWALWLLGYPEAALRDTDDALKNSQETGQAATLLFALQNTAYTHICCGNYAAANAQADEAVDLAHEKGASMWKARGVIIQGCVLALTGQSSDAVQKLTDGITALRSTEATFLGPWYLSCLAWAHATLRHHDEAWRCIADAMAMMETDKQQWCEVEVNHVAGEIALMSPEPDGAKARRISSERLRLHASSRRNPGNCAQR